MARTRGRCDRGERLRAPIPHGYRKTTTLVAGLRLSGISAPFVLDGPINRDALQTYVEQVLVPELTPGYIVVMDSLGSHQEPTVRTPGRAAVPIPRPAPDE
ncbi:Putative carboxy-terminus of transposase for insertion sequence NGRIS-7g [Methylorubrum extorquens]